jgi:single-stranded DNA-binding protein
MANKGTFFATVGAVGATPETKETSKGKIVTFRLAVQTGYPESKGEKGPDPIWYDVAVFKEALQPVILESIYKGAKVAVEGYTSVREYQGKAYHNIVASRVGIVEWLKADGSAAVPF